MPDQASQLFPLDCVDHALCEFVPPKFWRYCLWVNPNFGFWTYQLKYFNHIFKCYYLNHDGTCKQARQTGKTTLSPLPLGYFITQMRLHTIICSAALNKIPKITRPIIKQMHKSGERRGADSLGETRFDKDGAGFKIVSGKDDAMKEGETSHILVVDEGQDVNYTPVYAEISPFRDGVDGIIFVMGIGGIAESMIEKMEDDPDTLKLNIEDDEVVRERPRYQKAIDRGKRKMLSWEYLANYKGRRIQVNGSALLPQIWRWQDKFPRKKFNPDDADIIDISFDYGGRVDSSCAIAIAKFSDGMWVMFEFEYYAPGESYDTQLEGLSDFTIEVPWNQLKPETNNLGHLYTAMLRRTIDQKLREMDGRPLDDNDWCPVEANEYNIDAACRTLYNKSLEGNLGYVETGDHSLACVNDLKAQKVKYTIKRKMKNEPHSDWAAALRAQCGMKKVAEVKS